MNVTDEALAETFALQTDDMLRSIGKVMEWQLRALIFVGDRDRSRRLRDAAAAELRRRGASLTP